MVDLHYERPIPKSRLWPFKVGAGFAVGFIIGVPLTIAATVTLIDNKPILSCIAFPYSILLIGLRLKFLPLAVALAQFPTYFATFFVCPRQYRKRTVSIAVTLHVVAIWLTRFWN